MDYRAIAEWALSGSTGMSSKCIITHMMGNRSDGSYPHDGGDFDRCERLLDTVPGLRVRLKEMAAVNKYWAALVPKWNEIKLSKDKYALISSITNPIEDGDSQVVRLDGGAIMRFGNVK